MRCYEYTVVMRQNLTQQQVDDIAKKMDDTIVTQGGKVVDTEHWGLRNLAYEIKKNRKGHYVFMRIEASREVLNELERQNRINENIIRALTVQVKEHDKNPTAILTNTPQRYLDKKDDQDYPRDSGEKPAGSFEKNIDPARTDSGTEEKPPALAEDSAMVESSAPNAPTPLPSQEDKETSS